MSEFDRKAADWDMEPQRIELARSVAEAIVAQGPLSDRTALLDYGCGMGLLGPALASRVGHATLADSSEGML